MAAPGAAGTMPYCFCLPDHALLVPCRIVVIASPGRVGLGLLQHFWVDRHLAQTLSRRGEDSIGNGGNDRRRSGLAHASRRLRALDEVNLDDWRIVDPQHLVGVKIRLLDTAVLERDLAMERGRYSEDSSALKLRLH